MTKMRVYELAKELEMENKVLVDAIREMNIEVKSHSSSLSDEEVALIKGHLSGTKSLVVEEQRIKSTVIRRRRKIVEVAPEPAAGNSGNRIASPAGSGSTSGPGAAPSQQTAAGDTGGAGNGGGPSRTSGKTTLKRKVDSTGQAGPGGSP